MTTNNDLNITLPPFARPLLRENKRYKVLYGGRGSGKSYAVADSLLLKALQSKCLILCGREFQNSIKDSVHSLLSQRIHDMGLSDYFHIKKDELVCVETQSRFIFKGLRHNIDSIKSMAGINYLWIEEADTLSAESWLTIKPTIREQNSEIWITFNPKNKNDIVYKEFVTNTDDESSVQFINYFDNPFFTETLDAVRKRDKKLLDYSMYKHIWEGECLEITDAQVFKGKFEIDSFEPDYHFGEPLYGLDFGFSQDPTAAVACYIKNNILYIYQEAYEIKIENDHLSGFIKARIPGIERYTIRADSARPDTISYLKRHGLPLVTSVIKGKNSIEDGVAFMKSFDKIVLHEQCKNVINEFYLYSYKVDHRSGDISNVIVDKHNHAIDAIRYALEPLMKSTQRDFGSIL